MWCMLGPMWLCNTNAETLFAQTVYFDTSTESQLRAMNTLTYSFLTFFMTLSVVPIFTEMCLCVEMVQSLIKPMERSESRAKWYYLFITVASTVNLAVYAAYDFDFKYTAVQVCFYGARIFYLALVVPLLLFVRFHFNKGGLNEQFRKLHFRRYAAYCILFMFCMSTQCLDFATVQG